MAHAFSIVKAFQILGTVSALFLLAYFMNEILGVTTNDTSAGEPNLQYNFYNDTDVTKNISLTPCDRFEKKQKSELNITASMQFKHIHQVEKLFPDVRKGHWSPSNCSAVHKIAVLIPFRDRMSHLAIWLAHVVPILQRQRLEFHIIVVEQKGKELFNKGRLFNAAFHYIQQLNVNCTVLHDVDMLPESDSIDYSCPKTPRHLGAYVNTLRYELMYNRMVGGVLVMSLDHYRKVNGYSNMYWGWGAEDDDMGIRLAANNIKIERLDSLTARYTMLKHASRWRHEAKVGRFELVNSAKERWKVDGLNNTNMWRIAEVKVEQLYRHLKIFVGQPPKDDSITEFEQTKRKREEALKKAKMLREGRW